MKMYYLIRVKEDGTTRDYASSYSSNSESFGWCQSANQMMILTERDVCKYYGMNVIKEAIICEIDMDKRVELFVEFKPLEEPKSEPEKVIVKD